MIKAIGNWEKWEMRQIPVDPRKYLSSTGPYPVGFLPKSPLTKGCAGLSALLNGQRWSRMLAPPYQEILAMEKQSCSRKREMSQPGDKYTNVLHYKMQTPACYCSIGTAPSSRKKNAQTLRFRGFLHELVAACFLLSASDLLEDIWL